MKKLREAGIFIYIIGAILFIGGIFLMLPIGKLLLQKPSQPENEQQETNSNTSIDTKEEEEDPLFQKYQEEQQKKKDFFQKEKENITTYQFANANGKFIVQEEDEAHSTVYCAIENQTEQELSFTGFTLYVYTSHDEKIEIQLETNGKLIPHGVEYYDFLVIQPKNDISKVEFSYQ